GPGQFNNPQGIAVTAGDKIYVCDTNNHRVQILHFRTAEGIVEYVGQLSGRTLNQPIGVAAAANGRIFVTDGGANSVEEYNAAGTWSASHLSAQPPYSGGLSMPTGIAVDGFGQVIVCDTNHQRVVTVTSSPPFTGDFNLDGRVDSADTQIFIACM